MRFLLDTDICSAQMKGNARVHGRFIQYGGRLHMSCLTFNTLDPSEQPGVYVFLVACVVSVKMRRAARKALGPNIKCAFLDLTELDRRIKRHPRALQEFFGRSAAGGELQPQSVPTQLAPGTKRVIRIHVSSPLPVSRRRPGIG